MNAAIWERRLSVGIFPPTIRGVGCEGIGCEGIRCAGIEARGVVRMVGQTVDCRSRERERVAVQIGRG